MNKHEVYSLFSQRLIAARAAKSLTQAQLSSLVGISQRQIAAYEAGQSKPRPAVLMKLAKELDVSSQWLIGGFRENEREESVAYEIGSSHFIPVIKLGMVSDWLSSSVDSTMLDVQRVTSGLFSEKAFAIMQNDQAMASSDLDGYSFPKGSIIGFEPGIEIEDKDFVIALFANGKAIFRQYFSGMSECILMPLDERFPSERIETSAIESGEVILIAAVEVRYELPSMGRVADIP